MYRSGRSAHTAPHFTTSYRWQESLESILCFDGDGRLNVAKTLAARDLYALSHTDFRANQQRILRFSPKFQAARRRGTQP